MGIEKFTEADMLDIQSNPHKYGAPTFEEFKKNPEKWMGRNDEILSSADKGSQILRGVQKHIYEIEGYRCESLEEVEKVAASQGIPIRSLDYRPELIPLGGGKANILVKFVSKDVRERRADW